MIVGLDIGTSFIRVAIGDFDENGKLKIAGMSVLKSDGLRNGIIVNIEAAKVVIKNAIELAEQNAGLEVNSVYTAIGGMQISSMNSHGVVGIAKSRGNSREITSSDIDRVIDCAKSIKFPPDRQLLHIIPQNFIVDGIPAGANAPIDRMGDRLEADVHIITSAVSTVQNIRSCIDRAGYGSNGIMLKTLASTYAVFHDDELDLGSILIDLGAGTTDVIVLVKGAPIFSTSIQVGGNLVTNDIAIVKGISIANAEKIKLEYGCCWLENITPDTDSEVIIPGIGGRAPELTSKSKICHIIQPRMEEIFTMVRSAVAKNSVVKQLSGNIILTGGGARMEGVVELTQAVFRTSAVRLGFPDNLGGIEEEYRRPDFTTVIGLVIANKNNELNNGNKKKRKNHKVQNSDKKDSGIKRFFRAFF